MARKGKQRKQRAYRRSYLKKYFTSFSQQIYKRIGLTGNNLYTNGGIRQSLDSQGSKGED